MIVTIVYGKDAHQPCWLPWGDFTFKLSFWGEGIRSTFSGIGRQNHLPLFQISSWILFTLFWKCWYIYKFWWALRTLILRNHDFRGTSLKSFGIGAPIVWRDLGSDSSLPKLVEIERIRDANLVDRQAGEWDAAFDSAGRASKERNIRQKVDGKSRSSFVNGCECITWSRRTLFFRGTCWINIQGINDIYQKITYRRFFDKTNTAL